MRVPVPSSSLEASVEAIQTEVVSKEESQGVLFHWLVMLKLMLVSGKHLKVKSVFQSSLWRNCA